MFSQVFMNAAKQEPHAAVVWHMRHPPRHISLFCLKTDNMRLGLRHMVHVESVDCKPHSRQHVERHAVHQLSLAASAAVTLNFPSTFAVS